MVKLLECQKQTLQEEDLYDLVTHVLYKVLDIMESDLTPGEALDIRNAIKDWEAPSLRM